MPRIRLVDALDAARAALEGRTAPALADLFNLIHDVNPTGRAMPASVRTERYRLKQLLQSLLIRQYPQELRIQLDGATGRIIAIGHRSRRIDACHAVVDDLDEDARSWVRFELDTRGGADREALPPVMAIASSPAAASGTVTVEEELSAAERACTEYDYPAARSAFERAFAAAGGSVGTAIPLLGCLVDLFADYESAWDYREQLHARARAHPAVKLLLARAAAQVGDADAARDFAPDGEGPLYVDLWVQIGKLYLDKGEFELAQQATKRASTSGARTLALGELEEALRQQRATARQPLEEQLQLLTDRGCQTEAVALARDILQKFPESAAARQVVQAEEDRQEAARIGARERMREAQRAAQLQQGQRFVVDCISLHNSGRLADAWRAWLDLDERLRTQVEAAVPMRAWEWLRTLANSRESHDKIVHAALAAHAAMAQGSDIALAAACTDYPMLRELARFRQAAASIAAEEAAARRQAAQRGLQGVAECLARGEVAEARVRFDALPAVPAAERRELDRLGAQLATSELQVTRLAAVDLATVEERWFDLLDLSELLAETAPGPEQKSHWTEKGRLARARGSAKFRRWSEVGPASTKAVQALPGHKYGVSAYDALDADGHVLLGDEKGGWLFVERINCTTGKVVDRGIVEIGASRFQGSFAVLWGKHHFAAWDGTLFELEFAPLRVARVRHLSLDPNERLVRMMATDDLHLWTARRSLDGSTNRHVIVEWPSKRHVYTEQLLSSDDHRVAGLQPPGWCQRRNFDSCSLRTPRGRPHPLQINRPPQVPRLVAVSPDDPSRVIMVAADESNGRSFYVTEGKGVGTVLPGRMPLPDDAVPLSLATCQLHSISYLMYVDTPARTMRLRGLALLPGPDHTPFKVFDVPVPALATLLQDSEAQRLLLVTPGEGGLHIQELGDTSAPKLPVTVDPVEDWSLHAQIKMVPCGSQAALLPAPMAKHLLQQGLIDPAAALEVFGPLDAYARLALLQRLRAAGDRATIAVLEPLFLPEHQGLAEWRLWLAEQGLVIGDLTAVESALGESGDVDGKWSGGNAQHRHHLRAVMALQRGDTEVCRDELRLADIALPNLSACTCGTAGLLRIADSADRAKKCEKQDWLDALLMAIYAADGALAAGNPKAALDALPWEHVVGRGQTQSLARATTAFLSLPADPASEFAMALALAGLVAATSQPVAELANTLIVPGAHWSVPQLEALAERARDWLRQRVA